MSSAFFFIFYILEIYSMLYGAPKKCETWKYSKGIAIIVKQNTGKNYSFKYLFPSRPLNNPFKFLNKKTP